MNRMYNPAYPGEVLKDWLEGVDPTVVSPAAI